MYDKLSARYKREKYIKEGRCPHCGRKLSDEYPKRLCEVCRKKAAGNKHKRKHKNAE